MAGAGGVDERQPADDWTTTTEDGEVGQSREVRRDTGRRRPDDGRPSRSTVRRVLHSHARQHRKLFQLGVSSSSLRRLSQPQCAHILCRSILSAVKCSKRINVTYQISIPSLEACVLLVLTLTILCIGCLLCLFASLY